MNVWIQHRASLTVLRAQREPLDMRPANLRYWSGNEWSPDPAKAMLFGGIQTARKYRDAGNLSENVPVEWQTSQ